MSWESTATGGMRWFDEPHFRLMCFDRPVGPWRARRRDVELDATETGHGTRYRGSHVTYLTVPAWIQVVEATALTRATIRRDRRALVEVSRIARPRHPHSRSR